MGRDFKFMLVISLKTAKQSVTTTRTWKVTQNGRGLNNLAPKYPGACEYFHSLGGVSEKLYWGNVSGHWEQIGTGVFVFLSVHFMAVGHPRL